MTAQHLFVYGTLQPGKPNAHILEKIGGTFQKGFIRGYLHEEGWGATMGYPAVKLDPEGPRIDGYVFSSERLEDHWPLLDEFEGEAYARVRVSVQLENSETMRADIYQLSEDRT